MEMAGMDTTDMKVWLQTHVTDSDHLLSVILQKKSSTPTCEKCEVVLDYGGEDGKTRDKNNPKRASPDRIDNRMGYISSNMRMVCQACQTMASIDDPDDIFLNEEEVSKLLEYIRTKIP